jgi:hypothetical protein
MKELLINQSSFNNMSMTPTDQGSLRPQDLGDIIVRNQLVNENLPGNQVIRISLEKRRSVNKAISQWYLEGIFMTRLLRPSVFTDSWNEETEE